MSAPFLRRSTSSIGSSIDSKVSERVKRRSGSDLEKLLDAAIPKLPTNQTIMLSGGEGKKKLKEHIAKHMSRVQHLFRELDVDNTGDIDRSEMHKLVHTVFREQGAEAPDELDIAAFFDEFDSDGSGRISLLEFTKSLRSQSLIQPQAAPLPSVQTERDDMLSPRLLFPL